MDRQDFKNLSLVLLAGAASRVQQWIPGGRIVGNEYKVLNPTRADKRATSFSVNIKTGYWADFATGDRGRDLISLYAYINKIPQSEAARRLSIGG